jgi:hypothetical protein
MRVAIYARVSTDDKGQDPENQVAELRAWCAAAGHTITLEYVDHETGRKGAEKRKQFATLFADAAKRKFDCVLFWALDRFSREGMAQTIIHLQRLSSYGVAFHSYTEPHLATDNELARNILLAPALVAGQGRSSEDQRANEGRDGPSEGEGHQNRSAENRNLDAQPDRPAGCQGGKALRHRESARHRPAYSAQVFAGVIIVK